MLKDFGISHTYLDSIEKGYDNRTKKSVRITVDTLSKIAKALDEPLDKLVAFSENKDYIPLPNINFSKDEIHIKLEEADRGYMSDKVKDAIQNYVKFTIEQEKRKKNKE